MKNILLFTAILFLTSVIVGGCCNCRKAGGANKGHWVNPEIRSVSDPRIDSSGMNDGNFSDQEENSITDFIEQYNKLFSNSNGLSGQEAHSVYLKLFEKGTFKNEPVGMPSPDEEPYIETLEDFKQRVALRKSEQYGTYEFFLLKTGCGYSYIYGQIKPGEGKEGSNIEVSKKVHLSVPC